MDPTAEELHHTRHVATENNWKRKCAMEPSLRRFCSAGEIVVYDYIGNPKCFAAGPHAPGKSHAGRKSSPLRGINKSVDVYTGRVPNVCAAQNICVRIHIPQPANIPAHSFADRLNHLTRSLTKMPHFRKCARYRVLESQASVGLVAVFLGQLALCDILHHAFVIKYFAAGFIAPQTRVLQNPDDAFIEPVDL